MIQMQLRIKDAIVQKGLSNNVPVTYLVMKRLFDIVASFLGLVLLSPLFLIVMLLIKLDSKGPVFFAQERNGLMGKTFKIYKFRSMVANAEELLKDLESKNEVKGHMFKIKNDPRITRVGRIIRKTSIDELPQLFNVLKGDMSIVGPRPLALREVVKYDSWHNLRLSVKPGLIGLWHIKRRSNEGFDEMVRLDLKYVRERSFSYDLKIIIKTILNLLNCLKRGIDILGAVFGLIVFSPIFLIVAVLIKIDSKGPIFFKHKRIGQYGKYIEVYKFRTMVPNAEKLIEKFTPEQLAEFKENFKLKDDPRITRIGKILRKTSLDELPQLINILNGSMSIVGPRPIVKDELEKYGKYAHEVFSVKPGLTGLWQVSGRSDTNYEERVKMDVEYVNSMNILLDIRIIILTFIKVLKRDGAY